MAEPPLLVDRAGGIVTLTLNRPDVRNAMTPELTEAFSSAVEALRSDPEVRVVIVTGAGAAFCAGGDLSFIQPGPNASVAVIRAKMRSFYGKFLSVRSLDCPTIAAINGAAVGAGLCLAMACDIRVADEGAKLSTAFTRLGMHPGMAATFLLTRLVGTARAAELFFTARSIEASEAERLGLVNRVAPAGGALEAAHALAEEIAANAPMPMGMVKRAIYLAERADLEMMLEYEGLAQPITMATEDLLEGLSAAKERRNPEFRGR
jgi:enoyl-CoA hydratase